MKKLFLKIRSRIVALWQGFRNQVVTRFPGKDTVNLRTLAIFGTSVALVLAILYCLFFSAGDTSRLSKSIDNIDKKLKEAKARFSHSDKGKVKGVSEQAEEQASENTQKASRSEHRESPQINYRAKQVIERTDYADPSQTLPPGTEFVGKLLTSIDTRNPNSLLKIAVPFGGSFQGNEVLPKDSILFATASYDGNGEKVFLNIESGTYPDGQPLTLRAQVLSAKDYSPGIEGDYHSTFTSRVAANLGLNFVSGMSDALEDRESLGNGNLVSPNSVALKPTLKNGLLAGVSKVTDSESQRLAAELGSQKPFVTVDSGKDLIVSLLERFVKGSHFESGQKGR